MSASLGLPGGHLHVCSTPALPLCISRQLAPFIHELTSLPEALPGEQVTSDTSVLLSLPAALQP